MGNESSVGGSRVVAGGEDMQPVAVMGWDVSSGRSGVVTRGGVDAIGKSNVDGY